MNQLHHYGYRDGKDMRVELHADSYQHPPSAYLNLRGTGEKLRLEGIITKTKPIDWIENIL